MFSGYSAEIKRYSPKLVRLFAIAVRMRSVSKIEVQFNNCLSLAITKSVSCLVIVSLSWSPRQGLEI